ncbi:MAG: hypothetical protein IJW49_08200 [Clostridia bacterium]|nr:hypothetical protein [Clostridia bacterium]
MKNRIIYRSSAVCCLLLCAALFLLSCAPSPPDYFAFRGQSATAELRGELFGKSFCAKLILSPQESGCAASLLYLSLGEIRDLQISALYGADGETAGEGSVTLGGVSHSCEPAALQGLLAPAAALLTLCEPSSVTHQTGEYTLAFADGSVLTLGEDGIPRGVHTEKVDFWVVWWENAENLGK